MKVTLHATRRTPYCASRLVQAMYALWMETRPAPYRYCRGVGVYGLSDYGHA